MKMRIRFAAVFMTALALLVTIISGTAEARITKIMITSVETPTFGGTTSGVNGSVGAYQKLRGIAFGEVDPADPRNALLTDIGLAPRTPLGKVAYSMDIYILRPVNLSNGNQKLFMEVENRGNKLFGPFNLPLEERYGNHDGYVEGVTRAAKALAKERLLLRDDVQRYIDAAQASNVLR